MPELMISDKLKSCTWKPTERQNVTATRGGDLTPIEMGEPYWVLSFRYEELTAEGMHDLEAWIARRRGAINSFLAYKPSKPAPRSNAAADNSGVTVSGFNAAASTAVFGGLSGKMLDVPDMVAFEVGGGHFVGMVTELVSSTASTATVKTFPPMIDTAGATNAQIAKPKGEFKLIPSTLNMTDRYDGRDTVSFDARQVEP